VDTLPFQGGRSVHLVAVGERVIVVGATAQQLSFLAELKAEEATSLLEQRSTTPEPSVSAFAAQLFQSLRRDGNQMTSGHADIIGEYE
jgi:flagellar biogenesis protein FliO